MTRKYKLNINGLTSYKTATFPVNSVIPTTSFKQDLQQPPNLTMKVIVILATMFVVLVAADSPPAQFYCGRRLANAMLVICQSVENLAKRSPEYDVGWLWLAPDSVATICSPPAASDRSSISATIILAPLITCC